MTKLTTTASYSADHITHLQGLEAIRRLPGMYIGNNSVFGLHHLLMEPIDNATDEIKNGHGDTIRVTLHPDGSASVWDNARGIPVALKPDIGISVLTQVLTVLHAGGKFRDGHNGHDAYLSGSGGLHGIGVKATNAFSEWLVVEVRRHGVLFRQRFENGGKPVTGVEIIEPGQQRVIGRVDAGTELVIDRKSDLLGGLKVGQKTTAVQADPALGTGTLLHFRPHRAWFDQAMDWPAPDKSVPWDFNCLETRLEQVAHLHPGVTIELRDERGPKKEHKKRTFCSDKGLPDYMASLNKGLETLHKPIQFKGSSGDGAITVEVVLQYAGEETTLVSFVNSIPTPLGGTAVSGFQAGLTKAVNQFASDKKLLKDGGVKGEDVLLGLTAIVNVNMTSTPQFSSQTKEALTTVEAQGLAMSVTYENVLAYLNKHIPVGKTIVYQARAARRGREAAKAARQLVIRKSVLEVSELPGKLADVSRGMPVEQTILYIVEGDSAGGSCKQGRDRRHHAILPLRGKILNTERTTLSKALGNAEVKAIVAALGAGVGSDFKLEDMRYGAVALLTDADVDGLHIRTLLHTLFYRYMRPLVTSGRLLLAVAPLYQLKKGQAKRYIYSDDELSLVLKAWGREGITLQRYKGLGEMNPDQLRETVFATNPGSENPVFNEHLVRVVIADQHRAGQSLATIMGRSVLDRRRWLFRAWTGEDNGEALGNGDEDIVDNEE